ncbi:MAG TPA: hypothetical protein VES36_04950, partial [Candidatus Limnocylindrales bacterium]|nr:hypothetical protein [Candidatus Limnocylindrales bacterium]
TLPAHRDGIAPDPPALPDPDAVAHLIQHRLTLSGISALAQSRWAGECLGIEHLGAATATYLARSLM